MSSRINKIVELQVEIDDISEEEFEDVGIEIMSLVEEPAIGVHWAVFAAEQFVDKLPGESEDQYLGRCIPQLIKEGYDEEQASAICYSSFEEEHANDQEMVDGIIDLLNKVEDLENRMKMAHDVIRDFGEDNIIFDIDDFMTRIGFDINVESLPPYVDQLPVPTKEDIEKLQSDILKMASQSDFGEVLDIELTSYVNLSKTNFETIGEYLRGADALDVLSRISATAGEEVPEPQFRYTGPSAERNFCRALLALGKIYTRSEINRMNSINSGFAEAGKFSYSVFEYAGGVNCTHWFEAVRVFRGLGGRNVVISEGPATGDAGKSQNSKQPSPTGYVRNNARMSSEWKFAEDDDQMVITGPAMKAFQMIPRRDEDGNVFHVYFSDETIKKLSEKFLKQHKQHMTDIDHSMEATEDNPFLESWIVEDPEMDKAKALGFNPAKGDWYVSYKINNKETWELIKEGKLNGFSIAGQFLERNAK